jgi:DNA-binding MarR family transcriptional regulator
MPALAREKAIAVAMQITADWLNVSIWNNVPSCTMSSKTSVSSHPLARVFDEVIRLRSRLQTVFAGAQAGSGLSSLEMTVLTAAIEARKAPTVPQIGRSIGNHRQVIQRAANSLVEAGLLAIAPNPDHKRAHLLQATAKGAASYARATKRAQETTQGLMQTLESKDCKRLAHDLLKLRTRIESYLRSIEEIAHRAHESSTTYAVANECRSAGPRAQWNRKPG